ncbi:nucleotide pyrophosphohydrolase [Clostridium felsineum]|uniref:nucleotide pyrophosphohydrolase n=1 Tax=Clostridium felsineum TaxID=36839 RepID=UPI00214DEF17|nr:nucleotide pyrophosphohydrolase [Clostridium felsineum]MCR3759188.1 nucleotide pyrophosphohydrolase [Clostridium felsineum]
MSINELVQKAHENAVNHGFWEDFKEEIADNKDLVNNAIGNRLMLIVSEVAEAQDGLRKNDIDNFKEELADIAIRLGDLCGGLDIDLEEEIKKKMEINKSREYKHGKAF